MMQQVEGSSFDQRVVSVSCCSSSLAGGLASFLTSPLDLAKLRLQVDRSKARPAGMSAFQASEYFTYSSFFDVIKKTFVNEGGFRGLYRGAFARVSEVVSEW